MTEDPVDAWDMHEAKPTWNGLMGNLLGVSGDGTKAAALEALVAKGRPLGKSEADAQAAVDCLEWMGAFGAGSMSQECLDAPTRIDCFCKLMEGCLAFGDDERDALFMHHEFGVVDKDGTQRTLTSSLEAYGQPANTGGDSAMAATVGYTTGIAAAVVLDGLNAGRGVLRPVTKDIYEPALAMLAKEGLTFAEGEL
jgi:hypothetical protein